MTCSPAPTSTCCSASPAYRGNDYVAGLHDALGEDVGAAASGRRRCRSCGTSGWRTAVRHARGARRPGAATTVLDAVEDDVTPDDRMVIVHTSGSTSAPEGCDPPARVAARPPREPEPAPRPRRRACACSPTRPCSGSVGSPTTSSACSSPARRSCARPRSTRPRRSTSSNANDPSSPTGTSQSIAALVAHPTFADARLLVDPFRQPLPAAARRRSGPRTRSCATTCSA